MSMAAATATGVASNSGVIGHIYMINNFISPFIPLISMVLGVVFFLLNRRYTKIYQGKIQKINEQRLSISKREEERKEQIYKKNIQEYGDNSMPKRPTLEVENSLKEKEVENALQEKEVENDDKCIVRESCNEGGSNEEEKK